MAEQDQVQLPVDEYYRRAIEAMGQGERGGMLDWLNSLAHTMSGGAVVRGGVGDPKDILRAIVAALTRQEQARPLQRIPGDLSWVARIPSARNPGTTVPMVNETADVISPLPLHGEDVYWPGTHRPPLPGAPLYEELRKALTATPDMSWRLNPQGRFRY